ncbi:MAG: NAD(P)H-dependent oxidoreductase subunit E, partial [Oscillospiraceae bacterium]|nr:NAD(P)H-dependent oxidoreductase subunit E [Oscillospiraceae bacterium]
MQKKISNIPFKDTPEQSAKLDEVIAQKKDTPGAVMGILQEAQAIYGYLPLEVQIKIADGLNKSLE